VSTICCADASFEVWKHVGSLRMREGIVSPLGCVTIVG
jgi:hypothetical protein